MEKSCYELNPFRLSKNTIYKKLNFIQKAIYKELIDLLWMQENQFSMKYDTQEISEKINISSEVIDETMELLSAGNEPLIEQYFCFEHGVSILSSHLKEQIEQHKKQESAQLELILQRNKKTSCSLLEKVRKNPQDNELSIGYLEPEKRELSIYNGWLPTNRFDEIGQVFYVRSFFVKEIKDKYPSLVIEEQLQKILEWFDKNPERRRPVAIMNRFIIDWLERAGNPNFYANKDSGVIDEFEKEMAKFLLENDEQIAVNQ
jgi:hypothetical protein